jgi:purine-binding chemotaxis protein CheW
MSTTTLDPGAVREARDERQLVVFALHDEHYALPITSVREIIRFTPPKAKGAAGGLILGMISLRGRVLPVADLSSRLGRTLEVHDGTKILVVELSAGAIGLIVDSVDEVLLVPADAIEPMPVSEGGLGDEIAKVGDRLITLLDAERALGGALTGP